MAMNFAMSDRNKRAINKEKEAMRNFYMQDDDEYEDPLDFLDSINSSAAWAPFVVV